MPIFGTHCFQRHLRDLRTNHFGQYQPSAALGGLPPCCRAWSSCRIGRLTLIPVYSTPQSFPHHFSVFGTKRAKFGVNRPTDLQPCAGFAIRAALLTGALTSFCAASQVASGKWRVASGEWRVASGRTRSRLLLACHLPLVTPPHHSPAALPRWSVVSLFS
jgi:hypothetical protein